MHRGKAKLSACLVGLLVVGSIIVASCQQQHTAAIVQATGGNPARGHELIRTLGCATCHTVPGVSGANGLVGPSLERVGKRLYLAGRIQNTPDNMAHWVRFPREVDPETAMPDLGLTEQDARDITAYLYTLQ